MRPKTFAVQNPDTEDYVSRLLRVEEDPISEEILESAKNHGTPPLQVTALDARHLEVITRLLAAKKVVEIGTLCGFSAYHLAKALPADGTLWTLEKSEHHFEIAEKNLKNLPVKCKIQCLRGDALSILPQLEGAGPFDMVFIDADKESYPAYFQWARQNLRVGGALVADNAFLFGHITKKPHDNEPLEKLRQAVLTFNEMAAQAPDFCTTFFPTGEGLLVAVKKN